MKRFLAGALALSLASSGCSIAFLDKPRVTPDNKAECDSSYKYPLIDTAVGVVGISAPFIIDSFRDRRASNPPFLLYIPLWGAGVAGVISAIIGRSRVGRCRDLKESMAATAVTPPAPAAPQPTDPSTTQPPVGPPPPGP
ncbi:MAG TPA: hypothetical protein VLB44_00515 [Kofleriaceae bacterium]|nr:hypothetical protein [Kofleriaceae bacterium]